ncbi:hypothetical protein P879_03640 [Paragonimus westermani]|uniref:FHA domain-containing protein n=1 Tax=Paragonimus westermani TaxID=34504 RepID=A0A8T0DNP1_9TREM|nr:hypothetical protein P879_03640 [Paragonimus westermani]
MVLMEMHDWKVVPCCFSNNISRDPSCDISINLPTVAPVHCSLELLNNGLVQATSQLEDKFSMLINGVPLKGSCILSNACLLTAGDRKFRFFYPSSRKSVHFQREGNPSPAATPTAAGDVLSNSQTPQSVARSLKIATPDSMPKVHPTKKFTPKPAPVSPARSPRPVHITPKSTLGTRERYGPVPLRPPPTSPAIQVVRHAPAKSPLKSISSDVSKGRRSNTGTAQVHYTPERRTSGSLRGSNSTFVPKGAKRPNDISSRRNLTSQSPRLNTGLLRSPTPRKLLSPRHPNITTKSPVIGHVPSSVLPLRTVTPVSRSPSSNRKNVSQKNSPHSTSRKSSHKIATHTDTPTLKSTSEFDDKKSLSSVSPSTKTKCVQSQKFRAADVHLACPATTHHNRRNLKRPATARVSMLTENILTAASKRTKGVSFGPALSPEQFDKCLPPSTPVKKGAIPPIVYTPQSLSSPKLRSPTPFVQKPTPMLGEKTPNRTTAGVLFSPSYISTTPNRISGVISQPPTPDTNLLDSVSEYDSIFHSAGANPVATAHYSAPVSKSTLTRQTNIKANCRHSFTLGSTHFLSHYTEQKTLRVPPTTPASVHRYSYNDQCGASKSKLSPLTYSTDNAILSSQTKHGLLVTPSSKSAGQRSTKATPSTTFTAADLFTSNESVSSSAEKIRLPHSSLLLTVKHSPVSTLDSIQWSTAKTSSVTSVGRFRNNLESAVTPRLSGLAGMFGETSEVSSPARGVGRPRSSSASASGKRSSVSVENLVQQSAAKTPSMAGVRRLLKTPKSAMTPRLSGTPKSAMTPRLSGVAGMFEETSGASSPARGVGRPRSSALSGEKRSPVGFLRSIHQAAAKSPRLTGVRRLLKTPVVVKSPRLAGVRQLLKSPQALASPSLSGLKRLLKTPKLCVSPRLSGLADLVPLSPESEKNPAAIGLMLTRKAGRRQTAVSTAASNKPRPNPASSRLVRKRALLNTMSSDSCDILPPKIGKHTSPQAAPVRSTRTGSRKLPKPASSAVARPLTPPTESSRATARNTSRSKPVRAPSIGGASSPPKKPIKTKVGGVSAATEFKPTQKRTPVKNAPLRVTRQRPGLTKVGKSVDKPKEEHSSPTLRGRVLRTKKTSTTKRSVSKTVGPNSTTNITKVVDSPASSVQTKSLRTHRKRKSVPFTKDQAKKPRSTTRTMKKTTALLLSPVHSHVVVSPRRTRAANRVHK